MSQPATRPRRQFRNLSIPQILSYRLPPAAKVSIFHRISGVLLFIALPLLLLPLFEASLTSPESYAALQDWVSNPLCKIVLVILVWAYLHHLFAGIRFLLFDLHFAVDKVNGQKTAGVVFGVSLALTFVFALKIFGVW